MGNCYVCNESMGLFSKKFDYDDGVISLKRCICDKCNKFKSLNGNEKEEKIDFFDKKIGWFMDKNNIEFAKIYSKRILLMDNLNLYALTTLISIYTKGAITWGSGTDEEEREKDKKIVLRYMKHVLKSHSNCVHALGFCGSTYEKLGFPDQAATCAVKKARLEEAQNARLEETQKEFEAIASQYKEPIEDKPNHPSDLARFDDRVKNKCKLRTDSGLMVQSEGEKQIANFLHKHHIDFDYDEQITLEGNEENEYGYKTSWVRPDFYLTEFDIIIEYWGLKGQPDYDNKMDLKKRLYKEANKKFISLEPTHLENINTILRDKLQRFNCVIKEDTTQTVSKNVNTGQKSSRTHKTYKKKTYVRHGRKRPSYRKKRTR